MKALVFDLDDTLLSTTKEIGPRTRQALDRWLADGREIVLATSRPMRKVRAFLPAELACSCEIITMNGAVQHSAGVQTYKAPGLGEVARRLTAAGYPVIPDTALPNRRRFYTTDPFEISGDGSTASGCNA